MNRKKEDNHKVFFGSKKISFNLEYRDRKTLGISVHPNLEVSVRAPEGEDLDRIKEVVKKRATWILKQKKHFKKFHPFTPPRKYISGETHRYRGRQYLLKVMEEEEESVKLKGKFIEVKIKDKKDTERVRELLEQWYRSHAKRVFEERFEHCVKELDKRGIRFDESPEWQMRKMKKRWGSFTKSGRILLNPKLIMAPTHCIDYVIIHEICHLKYPYHNDDFYRILSRVIPDWEEWKDRLERFMV